MNKDTVANKYLPMTETAFYILLSLLSPNHGYGIKLHVVKITEGRVEIGAGTMYGTLAKMEDEKLIKSVAEEERRKIYVITDKGRKQLKEEITRLHELYRNGVTEMGGCLDEE